MRILFVGGTGLISSAVSPLLVERGHHLTLINRGESAKASAPAGAEVIHADARDAESLRAALRGKKLRGERYDAVVQWIGFDADHVAQDLETFKGLTDQYVFISSASAYQTPPPHLPIGEDTPLSNPHWAYSRAKAECERLIEASGVPYTIVRPSHTYGYPDVPMAITSWAKPWTIVDRIKRGGKIIMHGDGASLWTLTDHRDFAVGIAGLLGNPDALGEAVNITGDDVLSWNQIHAIVAGAVGVSEEQLAAQTVNIPSALLARFDSEAFEGPLMGDKTSSGIFDHSKVSRLVPEFATRHRFADSIHESIAWFEADESRRGIDADANALWDDVIARYERGVDAMFA